LNINSGSDNQEIEIHQWNLNVCLKWITTVYISNTNYSNIHFNIVFSCSPSSSIWPLPFRFHDWYVLWSYACLISCKRATNCVHLILLELIYLRIFYVKQTLWALWVCKLYHLSYSRYCPQ